MTVYTEQPRRILPLSLVGVGETVELVDIREQDAARQRLAEMGLTPGTVVRVVRADGAGAMILAIRHDTRLAVGHSTAHKMLVTFIGER